MRRLISVALGIVMIILAGCSFSVPVREEESTDSTVVINITIIIPTILHSGRKKVQILL